MRYDMETFFFYLLRVSIAAIVLYLFFRFILSKRTFHAINRVVVLGIVVMTLLLPLFTLPLPEIGFLKPKVAQPTIEEVLASLKGIKDAREVTVASTPVRNIPWITIIGWIYLAGLAVALLRFGIGFIRMGRIIGAATKERMADNSWLCISDQKVSPFSWMTYIVLSKDDFEKDSRDIIRHEQAHVAFRHSFDLLLLDLYSIVFWFNPFAWLLCLELRTIHEYQADEKVLAEGANVKNYQLSLIRQCVGENKFALANNFEYNNLQKRIKMTMKAKSSSKQKWLYGTIGLSVMLCLVILSSDGLKVKAAVMHLNEKVTTGIAGGTTAQVFHAAKGSANVTASTGGNDVEPSASTEQKPDSKKKGEAVRVIGYGAQAGIKPVIFIDGKESSQSIASINPDNIDHIEVLKGASATQMYGEKGKNGVVLVTTKKNGIGSVTGENKIGKEMQFHAEFHPDPPQPLFLVDGKEVSSGYVKNLSPENIESIHVLKDSSATRLYSTKGKNGVVLIKMKNS